MFIGYVRVSKTDGSQSTDPQKDALIAAGVSPDNIYEDYHSGANEKREGFMACMKALREGDTLVVYAIDRLGRVMLHLAKIITELKSKNVALKVLFGFGADVDIHSPSGGFIFNIFGAQAELERQLIIERTKIGLAAARARGRFGGRPRKMDATTIKMIAAAMSDRTTVVKDLAQKFGISKISIYKHVGADGTLTAKGQQVIDKEKKR